jgi:FixJ family two-component response regulator
VSTRGTVYLIDDDTSVRRALRRLLQVEGHDVVEIASADAFLSLPETRRPLCLLADIRMPGLTGLDLQNALYAEGRRLPIVFMTGYGDADMASRAMAGGAVAFLAKPVDDEVLLKAIGDGLALDRERLARDV